MRNLLCMSRVLVVAALTLVWAHRVSAQQSVLIRKQLVQMFSTQQPIPEAISSEAPSYANRQFWILRSSEPKTAKWLAACERAGIEPGIFLGNGLFIGSFPKNLPLSTLAALGFDALGLYAPQLRMDAGLQSVAFRINTIATTRVQVLPHAGLKVKTIKQGWSPAWGQVEEVWEGQLSKWVVACSFSQLDSLLHSGWAQWIEPAENELIPLNGLAASHSRNNYATSHSLEWATGLDGSGVTVGVGDGGLVETHADLEATQENHTISKIPTFADHQDHVTGTVGGHGFLQADKKGMAPGARVINLQTAAVISLGSALRPAENMTLTNNSYGQPLLCSRAGGYSATSAFIDDQIHTFPDLLHVFAAGNSGASACSPFPAGFQTIAEGYPTSKNGLTVGATLADDGFAWFSSIGPAKDGRLKPELVADGNNLYSTVPFDGYAAKGGTSMATPVVTGVLATLSQRYKQLNNNENPEAALLKALVCNTAEDLGRPQVDFNYGYGRLNARKARLTLENHSYQPGTIGCNDQVQFTLTAPEGARSVKIMLAWTDPAGPTGDTDALVNDLNLSVLNAGGTVFLPWTLSHLPANVNQNAQRKVDSLNNMEQATLQVTPGEVVTVRVASGQLDGPSQKFWVVYQWEKPELVLTSPVQNQALKAGAAYDFRWDFGEMEISSLVLQTSNNNGESWTDFQAIDAAGKRVASVSLPVSAFAESWFRLKAATPQGDVFSQVVKTIITRPLVVSAEGCHQSIKLSWNGIEGATRYEILQLDLQNGVWISRANTTALQWICGGLENGQRYVFAVQPWFATKAGLRADGKICKPEAGVCNWASDVGIATWHFPKTGRLHTASAPGVSPIQFSIRNFGNEPLSNQNILIYCQLPNGTVHQTGTLLYLNPGEEQEITLPWTIDLTQAGTYPIRCWLAMNGDVHTGNDSTFQQVRVISNMPLTLPWLCTAETSDFELVTNTTTALDGLEMVDFETTNQGRVASRLKNSPDAFGSRSLVVDKATINGKTAFSDLIFTLNLEAYANAEQLVLDFDWMALGPQSERNRLWVRNGDATSWKPVLSFPVENVVPGVVHRYGGLNLRTLFPVESFGSSFQLKFAYEGQKPGTMMDGSGYAVDNLAMYVPARDVTVTRLLSPGDGCTGSGQVVVRLKNLSPQLAENIEVGYRLSGGNAIAESIAMLAPGDSVDYTFQTQIEAGLVGKQVFKLWSRAQGDSYPTNDTVRNQMVFLAPVVSAFPYVEGFEQNDGYWHSTGSRSSWAWGQPRKDLAIIDTAGNGTNIWKTNLGGNYNVNELSYLHSPCFNLDGIPGDVQVSFNSIFNTETDYDYAWLEMSEDGKNWTHVGAKNNGTNWYNHDSQQWNGLRNIWEVNSYRLNASMFTSKQRVQFRVGFSSDASLVAEGIGIDDFHIEPAFSIIGDTVYKQTINNPGQPAVTFGPVPNKVAEIEKEWQMGVVTLEMKRNTGPVRYYNSIPYLDRNFLIVPTNQPQQPVQVRLYITDQEVKSLLAADGGMTSFQQLGVYKYDGANQDLTPENNDVVTGNGVFIPPAQVQKTPTAGGYYLEFTVGGFSEFYIAGRSFQQEDTPLPISLISFSARSNPAKGTVDLEWKTAAEVNCYQFVLSYSCDGKHFEPIENQACTGSKDAGSTYSYTHRPGCQASSLIYKLASFDEGQAKPAGEYMARCINPLKTNALFVENPIGDQLKVTGLSGQGTSIELVDALGKTRMATQTSTTEWSAPAHNLPPGSYWLRVAEGAHPKTVSLVKW